MPSKFRKKMLSLKIVFIGIATLVLTACGVKGDPLPPKKPAEVGRGQPTYRKATEKIPLQKYQPNEDELRDEKEPEDE